MVACDLKYGRGMDICESSGFGWLASNLISVGYISTHSLASEYIGLSCGSQGLSAQRFCVVGRIAVYGLVFSAARGFLSPARLQEDHMLIPKAMKATRR